MVRAVLPRLHRGQWYNAKPLIWFIGFFRCFDDGTSSNPGVATAKRGVSRAHHQRLIGRNRERHDDPLPVGPLRWSVVVRLPGVRCSWRALQAWARPAPGARGRQEGSMCVGAGIFAG
jgi:hypothetical protein